MSFANVFNLDAFIARANQSRSVDGNAKKQESLTAMPCDLETLKTWAAEEVEEIIESLPAELREKARALPVTIEAAPSGDLVEDGIEPDTLGLFVGPDYATDDPLPIPSQVILFLENLWDFCDEEEEIFREEVRRTYLHELGHYLGLDEEDLCNRGLE